jgi:hypothetical protein
MSDFHFLEIFIDIINDKVDYFSNSFLMVSVALSLKLQNCDKLVLKSLPRTFWF